MPTARNSLLLLLTCATLGNHHLLRVVALLPGDGWTLPSSATPGLSPIEVWERRDAQSNNFAA